MSKRTVFGKNRDKNRFRALLVLILSACLSSAVLAQKNADQPIYAVSLREVSRDVYKRAAQFLEDMRYDTAASNWKEAALGERVYALYRPDLDGIAYYEFPLFNAKGENVGFVTVSNGEHEQPIANWSDKNNSQVEQLLREAAAEGLTAARIYKLSDLSYVAEDEAGRMVARTKDLPIKITGQQMDWLDREIVPATIQSYAEGGESNNDEGNIPEQKIVTSGETAEQFGVEEWQSWEELKANYAETYAVINEAIRRESAADWRVERALQTYGEGFFADEIGIFPTLSREVRGMTVIKGSAELFRAEVMPREGTVPAIKISSLRALDGEVPVEIRVDYATESDIIKFTILPERYRELIGESGLKVKSKMLKNPFDQSLGEQGKWYGFGTGPWGPWYTSWAAHHNDQRLYDQIPKRTGVNSSNCWSGCGATAWAMLFGWGDHRAWEQDPTWLGRFGLYRQNGGFGFDAHAPLFQDAGVNNMMWEIRNDINTFCLFGNGATLPSTMWKASFYLSGRTFASISTSYNAFGFGLPWLRDAARNSIVNRDVPVIIGTGFLSHYPLAYGYQERTRKINLGFWQATDYDRQFYVNMGWGGSSNQWVAGHTWFVGQLYPNWTPGTNQLIAKHSNKCLDVFGGAGGDGANVQQWGCHGGNNQKWRLEPVSTVGNYYRILAHHSGKALDVSGISTANGANVHQWEWWMGNNQLWEIVPQGGGYSMLRARHSNKCLDVSGGGTANGANVIQHDCHGGDNQLWRIVP